MKRDSLEPEFVEAVPTVLQEGKLYISIRYRTSVHLCACGCGNKVVTPIKPAKWHLTYDGATVSLSPSVGNWQFPCRSHYVIRHNKVDWARPWSDEQVRAGRERDALALRDYYARREQERTASAGAGIASRRGLISRIRRLRPWTHRR
jgi:hypothetical protein